MGVCTAAAPHRSRSTAADTRKVGHLRRDPALLASSFHLVWRKSEYSGRPLRVIISRRIATKSKDSSLADELQSRSLPTMSLKNDIFSWLSENPPVPDGGSTRRDSTRREENDFERPKEPATGAAARHGGAGRAALTNIDRVSHHALADGKHGPHVRTL